MIDKSKKDDYVIIEGPIKMINFDIEKEKEKIEEERRLDHVDIHNKRNKR